MNVCGTINDQCGVVDPHGCRLPSNHSGAHEFVSECGRVFQWETDFACTCDHCTRCEGDYCTLHWEVAKPVEPMVLVPKEWADGVIRFMAHFTTGNSVPIQMVPLARRSEVQLKAEATRLRDLLRKSRGEDWW